MGQKACPEVGSKRTSSNPPNQQGVEWASQATVWVQRRPLVSQKVQTAWMSGFCAKSLVLLLSDDVTPTQIFTFNLISLSVKWDK